MGPATVQLICGICLACCLISLLVAYFVWAIITVFTSEGASASECGAAFNIWAFCLTVVIIIPILGCVTAVVAALARMPGLQAIPPLINLAMAVWGMVLWGGISEDCWLFYDHTFWDLALLFKINVILLSISFFVFLCVICLGAAFLGGAVANGGLGRDGYNPMGGDDAGPADEALRTASREGNVEQVENLLREGARVDGRDSGNGRTALHYAAEGGHTSIAQRLVNAGANIDAEAGNGETPLHLARDKGEVEAFLRQVGARDSDEGGGGAAATQEYV